MIWRYFINCFGINSKVKIKFILFVWLQYLSFICISCNSCHISAEIYNLFLRIFLKSILNVKEQDLIYSSRVVTWYSTRCWKGFSKKLFLEAVWIVVREKKSHEIVFHSPYLISSQTCHLPPSHIIATGMERRIACNYVSNTSYYKCYLCETWLHCDRKGNTGAGRYNYSGHC